jgi:phage tail tape-measure protein
VARESEAKSSVVKPKDESSNVTSNVSAVKTPVATARKVRGNGWVSQWGSKLGSLVSQRPKSARSAIQRFNSVPVQGELSLDKIKVVRNDLSDTDLEVVTRKASPPKETDVGRASSRAAEVLDVFGSSTARGDARPTMSEMLGPQ